MTAEPGTSENPSTRHATTVIHAGRAALICGKSGTGKSALALQLLSLGAKLIADDRTVLHRVQDEIVADSPGNIRGKIEARGVGILNTPPAGPGKLALVIDMDTEETARLPPFREVKILGVTLPLLRKVAKPHFPAAIMAYLKQGRTD